MAIRESRPSGIRAVHQAAAAGGDQRHHVADADAILEEGGDGAAGALGLHRREMDVVEHDGEGAPARLSATVFVETATRCRRRLRGRRGTSGTSTASKLASACGTSFSVTTKSSRLRPRTGWPFLSTTATSTVTSSTPS